MRSVYMGDCRLGGGTVRYHLLVEEVEGLGAAGRGGGLAAVVSGPSCNLRREPV